MTINDLEFAHIKSTCDEDKYWCGEPLDQSFHFKDAEIAAINGKMKGKIKPCQLCVDVILTCLK